MIPKYHVHYARVEPNQGQVRNQEDIIKDSIIIFTKESVRTAKEKVAEEKIINATEYYIKY